MTPTQDHPALSAAGSAAPSTPHGGVASTPGPSRALPPSASGPGPELPAPVTRPPTGAGTLSGPGRLAKASVAGAGKTPEAGATGRPRPSSGSYREETDGQRQEVAAAPGRSAGRAGAPGDRAGDSRPEGQQRAEQEDGTSGHARTWTIELPAGLKLLSLNDRLNRYAKNERFQVIKNAAIVAARQAKLPQLQRARIVAVYEPPDRRRRDADNPIASVKAAVDGLVVAQVLPNDECPRYVTGIYCTIGEPHPKGRLVIHVTEAEPLAEAA